MKPTPILPTLLALTIPLLACTDSTEQSARFEANPSASGAAASAPSGSGVAFASLTYEQALARAGSEKKLVMVDMYTDWCGWCKKLDRDVFSDSRVAAAMSASIVPIKLDAEKSGEGLASRFQVSGFPTILFLSPSGQLVKKVEGYVPADEMIRIVSALART